VTRLRIICAVVIGLAGGASWKLCKEFDEKMSA
jgi:hypothetical protein